jgi:hypothetical protein
MPCPVCADCDGPYPGPSRGPFAARKEETAMADKQEQGEQLARVVVDEAGNPVEEGDPQSARILTGADAEAVLRAQHRSAEHAADAEKAQQPAANKARTSAPENKGR